MLNPKVMWICVIGYLLVVMGISQLISWREKRKKGHYNVFKTTLPWPLLVMTYIASLMSVWVFFAGPGGYYRGGLTYWFSEMTYFPIFVVIMYFSTNKVWIVNAKRNYVTPSDCFYDRYRSQALRIITGIIFLVASIPYVTSVMVSIAQAASVATGGRISYTAVVLIIGLAMVVFTAVGGFKAVAWTDTIQGLVFMFCLAFIAIVALIYLCGGSVTDCFNMIYENVGESWFSYPGTYEWTGYGARFGYPFSCLIGYTIMLPHVFVRSAYSGDDLRTQRKVMTITPILQALVWTLTFLIGAVGMAAMPGLDNATSEMIIPHIIETIVSPSNHNLAVILMIMFFVGAAGVGISTADSFLLVGASVVSDDFIIHSMKKDLTNRQKETIGRIVIMALGVVSVIMALNPPQLIYTLIMFSIAIVMPLFPILIYGIYWKRATKKAAVICSIVGTILVLMTYFVWNIGGTWYGAIGLVANVILMPIISKLDKPDDPAESADFFQALNEGHIKFFDIVPLRRKAKENA